MFDINDEVGFFAASAKLDEEVGASGKQVRAWVAVEIGERASERSWGFVVKPLHGKETPWAFLDA